MDAKIQSGEWSIYTECFKIPFDLRSTENSLKMNWA